LTEILFINFVVVVVILLLQDQHCYSLGGWDGCIKTHFGTSGAANGVEYGQTPATRSRKVRVLFLSFF